MRASEPAVPRSTQCPTLKSKGCRETERPQLRRVGLDVKVRTEEYGTFATKIKSNQVAPIFIQPHGNVWLDPLPQIGERLRRPRAGPRPPHRGSSPDAGCG